MKHASTCLAAVATATALCSPTVFAQASSNASLSDFRIELFDFKPDDGIPPSVTFSSATGGTNLTIYYSSPTQVATTLDQQGNGPLAGLSLSAPASGDYGAVASLSGEPLSGTGLLQAGASAKTAGTVAFGNLKLSPLGHLDFTLSPSTLMLVEAHISLSATATNTGYDGDHSRSRAEIGLYGMTGDQGSSGTIYNRDFAGYELNAGYGVASEVLDKDLVVQFGNTTGAPISGQLYGSAFAIAYGAGASTIPEPASAALALGGLLCLGGLQRRRRGL